MKNTILCPHCQQKNEVKALNYICWSCNKSLKVAPKVPSSEPKIEKKPSRVKIEYPTQNVQSANNLKEQAVDPNRVLGGKLVLHTEGRDKEIFNLYEGENYFGTPAHGHDVDIPIEKDKYVSRCHASIEIKRGKLNRLSFCLKDNGARRGNKGPSTNGTFINGVSERLKEDEVIYLKDGDNIQVGETKLRFKELRSNQDEMATAINDEFKTKITNSISVK
jgi:hypothetical protein